VPPLQPPHHTHTPLIPFCSLPDGVPWVTSSVSPTIKRLMGIFLSCLIAQVVSWRPLETPGRKLTNGQGGWFLHHPGQPELARWLLHLCQVLVTPNTTWPFSSRLLKPWGGLPNRTQWSEAWWLRGQSIVAYYQLCAIHFLPRTCILISSAHWFVLKIMCMFIYLPTSPGASGLLSTSSLCSWQSFVPCRWSKSIHGRKEGRGRKGELLATSMRSGG
jgi:hypothetical protein